MVTAPGICILKPFIIEWSGFVGLPWKGFLRNIKQVEIFFRAGYFFLVSKITLHTVKGWLAPNVNNWLQVALDASCLPWEVGLWEVPSEGTFWPPSPLPQPLPHTLPSSAKENTQLCTPLWITKLFFVYIISFNPHRVLWDKDYNYPKSNST